MNKETQVTVTYANHPQPVTVHSLNTLSELLCTYDPFQPDMLKDRRDAIMQGDCGLLWGAGNFVRLLPV